MLPLLVSLLEMPGNLRTKFFKELVLGGHQGVEATIGSLAMVESWQHNGPIATGQDRLSCRAETRVLGTKTDCWNSDDAATTTTSRTGPFGLCVPDLSRLRRSRDLCFVRPCHGGGEQ